ncbi:hypothetical protein EDL98_09480 [Ornithobacterium rhinotracheale]|uniref:hypothetical protein n=1 Tax=Ornithobacterium rhinotracheale TaxID=28251 RepID=UPI00129D19F1|nr:hypothetical protein [Ornithobacterium rhinotracheale]MRJ11302.1 hypothetical protein [Ornithobacterium rhinotracheale]
MKIKATDVFLALLALMLISVSFWQTWLGLSQIFGEASFVIALVLSLLLLFLLWLLRSAKLQGKPTAGLVGIYIFIASFCFIANFNALYTRFMKTEIYTNELKRVNDKFNALQADIDSRLTYTVDAKTRQDIIAEVNQLIIQIEDPQNQGIGTEAKAIIARIEKKLGKPITPLTPVEQSQAGYRDLAERMAAQILNMMTVLNPDEKELKETVDAAVLKWNRATQKLLAASPDVINTSAVGQIEEETLEYNKLGNKAENVLGANKYKFEPLKSEAENVGKIGYAFRHAIHNFGMYQFVVLAGCILLDFVMVIIVLLVTDTDRTNNNRVVFQNKSRTLID